MTLATLSKKDGGPKMEQLTIREAEQELSALTSEVFFLEETLASSFDVPQKASESLREDIQKLLDSRKDRRDKLQAALNSVPDMTIEVTDTPTA